MQVADCYIRVEYRQLRPGEFERLSEDLYEVATDLTRIVKRAQDLDFTFEEGSLIQRILLIGTFLLTSLDTASHYHDLRESIVDALHDEAALSHIAIKKFHEITHTTPSKEVYKRTSSRDMNRLHRVVSGLDRASHRHISHKEHQKIRSDIVHDLAGLARSNPNDPEIDKILRLLPKHQFLDLPTSAAEAIAMDPRGFGHPTPTYDEPVEQQAPRPHRRRFHKHLALRKR